MEKYTMLMDQKNQYSENEYTTRSNLQIQCNPYQATSHIFHRTRTNNFKICMEIQKTSNSESKLIIYVSIKNALSLPQNYKYIHIMIFASEELLQYLLDSYIILAVKHIPTNCGMVGQIEAQQYH